MEEKKTSKKAAEKAKEPAVDVTAQMQAVMQQANERLRQVVEQARQMEQMLRDRTVDHLFNVLKYQMDFSPEFVEKSTKAIEAYLTSIAFNEEETEQKEQVTE